MIADCRTKKETFIDFYRYMPKITNREKVLIALLETPSIREAAKSSGISEAAKEASAQLGEDYAPELVFEDRTDASVN